MRAVVLGAAAGGGYPQWNCRCATCTLAWNNDPRVRRATQSSIAVSADGASWVLLNASPDIGVQIAANAMLQPVGPRVSPIGGVVLTSADIDHIAGLLTLRESRQLNLLALAPVRMTIETNPVFSALKNADWIEAEPGTAVSVAGLEIALVPVPGKAPLYLEGDDPEIGAENGEAAAVIVRAGGTTLVYAPGCAAFKPRVIDLLQRADILVFDGTLFTDDEMIRMDVGRKTGLRMGHLPISGPGGSLGVLKSLPAARKIYIHLNNTNPAWISDSAERREIESAGIEVAYDGMEIVP